MVTKCKLRTVYQLINEQGLYYIHKIQATKTPASIHKLYNINDNTRPKLNLRPIYNPKSIRLQNSLFYKYTELYIEVPEQTKNIQLIKFVKYSIRDYVDATYNPFEIPNINNNDTLTDTEKTKP